MSTGSEKSFQLEQRPPRLASILLTQGPKLRHNQNNYSYREYNHNVSNGLLLLSKLHPQLD